MKLETKFNPYDEIFFLHNKKVITSKIRSIKVEIISNPPTTIDTEVTYLCSQDADAKVFIKVDQKDAYETKEKLLKSL